MCPTLVRTQYHHPLKECRAKSSKNMKENSRNLTASKREFPREWKRYFKIAFQSTRFPMESNFQPLILDLNTTSSNNIPTILFSNFLHRSSKAKYLKNFTILSIIFGCRRDASEENALRRSDLILHTPRTIIILLLRSRSYKVEFVKKEFKFEYISNNIIFE